jgi:serine protease AprX
VRFKADKAIGRNERNSAASGKLASKPKQGFLGVVLLLLMLVPGLARAQSQKLSPDLERVPGGGAVDVIIQYRTVPTPSHFNRVVARGGLLHHDLRSINAGAFRVPVRMLAELAKDPEVKYVSLDRPVGPSLALLSQNPDFYEGAVVALSGWNLYDGSGIGIAVIDSGITNSGDFGSRIVYNQSFVSGQTSSTTDAYGHGTHVAGILAGDGANSTGSNFSKTFVGVAYGANLINLRVLDQNGAGTDSQVIAAIQQAVSLKSQYNIRIINLSLGRGVYESYTLDPLCQAVESAWKAGIFVAVAAGNNGRSNAASTDGYGTINAPGNDPYVMTVGAMKPMGTPYNTDDLIASYSSKGPTLFDHVVKPDIVAPGNEVISVLASTSATLYSSTNSIPTDYYNTKGTTAASSTYFKLNGTSMATPVVSGTVALMLNQNSALTPDQIKARMMVSTYKNFPTSSTATDPTTGITYTSQYDVFTIGAGYLNIQNVLVNTDLAPSTVGVAQSPTVAKDAAGNYYLVTGSSVVWGTSVVWGKSVVWGTSVFSGTDAYGESVLWGSSVVWGTSTDTGYSVVWGTAAQAASAASVVWGSETQAQENALQIVGEQ